MTRKAWMLCGSLFAVGAVLHAGCGQFIKIPLEFPLGAQGTFTAQAGAEVQKAFSLTGAGDAPDIGSGTIRLSPSAITVTPTQSGTPKARVNAQEVQKLVVTAWIGGPDDIATVCGGGEEYGPFTVTLDENNVATSVDPGSVTLKKSTVDLINSGSFTACLSVVSPIDATITIEKLDFTVSP